MASIPTDLERELDLLRFQRILDRNWIGFDSNGFCFEVDWPQWDLETQLIAYLWLWPPRDARLPGRLQEAAEELCSVVLLVEMPGELLELIFKPLQASEQLVLGHLRDVRTVLTPDVAGLHIGPCDLR